MWLHGGYRHDTGVRHPVAIEVYILAEGVMRYLEQLADRIFPAHWKLRGFLVPFLIAAFILWGVGALFKMG